MVDIFGKYSHEYDDQAVFLKAGAGVWDQEMIRRAQELKQPRHDFGFTPGSPYIPNTGGVPDDPIQRAVETISPGTAFVTNQLQALNSYVHHIYYKDQRYEKLVPLINDGSIPEGAVTYAYRKRDKSGKSKIIDYAGTKAERVGLSQSITELTLDYHGIDVFWTDEELRQAQFGGVSLKTDSLEAAYEACMDDIEQVVISGKGTKGGTGLINLPITGAGAVEHVTGTTTTGLANYATMDTTRKIQWINDACTKLIVDSDEVVGTKFKKNMMIYMPINIFTDITTRPVSTTYVNGTIWSWLKTNNAWTVYTGTELQLMPVKELSGAGRAQSNNARDRVIFTLKDRDVLEVGVAYMPRAMQANREKRGVYVPLEFKISDLVVHRPELIHYYDETY